jgi:uncharacterized protein
MRVDSATAIAQTEVWLVRAVIGLNLCPFAKAVHVKDQIHYAVCETADSPALRDALIFELKSLVEHTESARSTTLLIAPNVLNDFLDFNDFLAEADEVLDLLRLDGVIQIASFHPQYQFAGTAACDITNYSNRSPYPTLHLLREASVEQAVQAFPDAAAIYENNMQTLNALGVAGWEALDIGLKDTGLKAMGLKEV